MARVTLCIVRYISIVLLFTIQVCTYPPLLSFSLGSGTLVLLEDINKWLQIQIPKLLDCSI